MKSHRLLTFVCAALCSLTTFGAPSTAQLENLTKGMNVSWFGSESIAFDEPKARQEIEVLNNTGVRHVRIFFNTRAMTSPESRSVLLPHVGAEVLRAVKVANQEGLAVIVSPFNLAQNGGRTILPQPGTKESEDMILLWNALAKELAQTNPGMVFLEIAAEPSFTPASSWPPFQLRCHQAIREAAPNHVIIATAVTRPQGCRWDTINNLVAMTPIPDELTVYNFQYRSPFVFTYQGRATNYFNYLLEVSKVPYPSNPDNVADLLSSVTDSKAAAQLKAYGEEKWDRNRIRQDIMRAADWAQKHKVHLTCNELGVLRKVSPPEDRITYLRDVREIFDEFGISWTSLHDNGGIVTGVFGKRGLDQKAADALGLVAK